MNHRAGKLLNLLEDSVLLEEFTAGVNGLYTSATYKPVLGKTYEIQVIDKELGKAVAIHNMNLEKIDIISAQYTTVADANHEYTF